MRLVDHLVLSAIDNTARCEDIPTQTSRVDPTAECVRALAQSNGCSIVQVATIRWRSNFKRRRKFKPFSFQLEQSHISFFIVLHIHINYGEDATINEMSGRDRYIFGDSIPPGFDLFLVGSGSAWEIFDRRQFGVDFARKYRQTAPGQQRREF